MEKKDKRTESLTPEEIQMLKDLAAKESSFTDFAIKVRLERVRLTNTIIRGSGSPRTIKIIRKYLQKQLQPAA